MLENTTKLSLSVLQFCVFVFLIGMLDSCSSDSINDPRVNPNPEIEEALDLVYINNQTDFDLYKNAVFAAGARVYFAAGEIFNGEFAPTGSGTSSNQIVVTAYNAITKEVYLDAIDNKPIINGHGIVNATFFLHNVKNWEINNLEITNTDGTDNDQGNLRGIYLLSEDIGTIENTIIRNCYVHDVNGKVEGKERGGIHVHVKGTKTKTKYDNLLIENNYIKDVGGVGIGNQSTWKSIGTSDYHPWTNYRLRGNRIESTGRNGVIIRASINPIAEYNVIAYSSRYSTGHNMFNFNTTNCIMQYNEAYGNTGDFGDKDRGGFDADYNCENTTIQYNYSHDNHWFLGLMRKYNKGITVRYNISVNDRIGAYEYGFPDDIGIDDVLIYNNTHYFGSNVNASPFASPSKTRVPINTTLKNNIFYFENPSTWAVFPDESCFLSNNLFYNVSPIGNNALTSDPLFENSGDAETDIDMTNLNRLMGYKLKTNSPCNAAGLMITDNGGKDFWGNVLTTETTTIGAYEIQ